MRVLWAILLLLPTAVADHPGSNHGLAGHGIGPGGTDNIVHNVFTVDAQFAQWEADYPEYVERIQIGLSEGGQPLHGIIVTDENTLFDAPPHTAATKYRVYLDGGHHGNEFLGVEIMMYYLEELLDLASQGDEATLARLAALEIHAVPILNVEGNLRDTRVNMNLVDPNRNYDFGHSPCTIPSLTCGGPEPFSESEIRANADYVLAISPDLWLSMHTGIATLFYNAGEPFIPEAADQALFAAMEGPFEASTNGVIDMMGGPAPAVGSADDWGYAEVGVTTFTYEVHEDQNLPVYGEPLPEVLADQLNGLRFLIDGAELWGAFVSIYDNNTAYNGGWGIARNVTVIAGGINHTIAEIPSGAWVSLPFTTAGVLEWSYPVLQVDASRVRSHYDVFPQDAETATGYPTPMPAALLVLGLLWAVSRRR